MSGKSHPPEMDFVKSSRRDHFFRIPNFFQSDYTYKKLKILMFVLFCFYLININ
jgi:hypothetical protein